MLIIKAPYARAVAGHVKEMRSARCHVRGCGIPVPSSCLAYRGVGVFRSIWEFPKVRVPYYFGVLIIRILHSRVLY